MRFSNEAMRDVLLFLEEKIIHKYQDPDKKEGFTTCQIVEDEYFDKLFAEHSYSRDELSYTIIKMIQGGLLDYSGSLNSYYQITDMSFYSTQLLKNIRAETTWEKTKTIANKVGNHTLHFLEDTAQKIATTSAAALIKNII